MGGLLAFQLRGLCRWNELVSHVASMPRDLPVVGTRTRRLTHHARWRRPAVTRGPFISPLEPGALLCLSARIRSPTLSPVLKHISA
jgi:hypothetical protein